VNGETVTALLYVDDIMILSKNEKLIDETIQGLEKKYINITSHEGDTHEFLGMRFKFHNNIVSISMEKIIQEIISESDTSGIANSPATDDLFEVDSKSEILTEYERERFHSIAAKVLYIAKRTKPELMLAVGFLLRRVTKPTKQDQTKLERLLKYINNTQSLPLILGVSDDYRVSAYADAAFAVHEDRKSHTGICVTLGVGTVLAHSTTQKLVTKSSTEAEIVAASAAGADIISLKNFLKHQNFGNNPPGILHQDNEASIKLLLKGHPCSVRTRHIDIHYFWVSDSIQRGEIELQWTGTKDMISDVLTKPLQGSNFSLLRDKLIGNQGSQTSHEECVGKDEIDDRKSVDDGTPGELLEDCTPLP
jgi:hypothetical protein